MIPRLHYASSRVLSATRMHRDVRLAFSSSAVSFARRIPERSTGERAKSSGNEDEAKENEYSADEGDEELNRWLFTGKEKVKESEIRSYKDPYGHFLKHVAPSFREPSPRKWLGRDVPFPLNLSFKPPVPLSDELRTHLYRAYMINPELNSVRALATRHNISLKRVDAILRLKGMEKAWEKNKPLQTGFTRGMERLLGVTETTRRTELEANALLENDRIMEGDRADTNGRYDVQEADLQDEEENNSRARQRYQRLFWESVAEGDEPVMPSILEAQRGVTLSDTKLRGRKVLVKRAAGRPAIMFIDVGNAFVDEKEKERREREGARRSTLKARKRMRDHGLHA